MSEVSTETKGKANASLLIRGAIWIAIGALIAAALVCVVWVLIGDQDGIIGRAFLTILLLAGFAGVAILEAGLAPKRPDWLALASMITWIVALLVGAIKIWLPEEPGEYAGGIARFFQLLLVVGILQLALLHVRLFTPAAKRYVTTFTTIIYYTTIAVLVLLVAMLVIYLTLPDTFEYGDLYWRIVVALAILAAVGTTLIPLLNALFAPKKTPAVPAGYAPQAYASAPAIAAPVQQPAQQQWPTYADGATPLPVLQDGSPDWNAYYTGYPTAQQSQFPEPNQYFGQYQDPNQYPAQPDGHAQQAASQTFETGPAATPQPYAPSPTQPAFVSSPDAPIGPDGLPVPPAGAPAAPDGIAGDTSVLNVPPMPDVPPVPDLPPTTPPPAEQQPPASPGAFPPPPPAPPQ
ncbi:hypothetical protein [Microbacterium murale]|uniref:FtsH-binding integral membrane protein n=1 Tax=Microbacterium murale TaxID=1081040 RepID=A0ABU0PC21_9MICO|nr:hypothetical protein [Microbacterium murale]MDQ0644502.1 FtsH-binding integral membrane protein [Microbacterium murale]